MSGQRDWLLLVDDMVVAASRMIDYSRGASPGLEGLDQEKADAILFNLAVLGEAAKNVPAAIKAESADIPWTQIAMTRDKVIHHYHGIDWRTVSDIVENRLPELIPRLERLRSQQA